MNQAPVRSGRCALVGRPNVGKSTLLNALLGQKLAIATPKPQTTRTSLMGVYLSDEPPVRIAFVDTPGLHEPRNALGRVLVEDAKASAEQADVVVVMIAVTPKTDPRDPLGDEDRRVLELARKSGRPIVLAINQVDRLRDKRRLLPLLEALDGEQLAALVPLSALRHDNIEALVRAVYALLPEGEWVDGDVLTDRTERFFAAELLREAVIVHTRQEIPYCSAVYIDEFRDEPALTRIAATIVVEKPSHKGIVIGAGGRQLKEIGSAARREIEALLGRKVFVSLWVKVLEDWTRDAARAGELARSEEP